MNKVRLLALDVIDGLGLYEVYCDNDDLQSFYDVLKCSCFDIARRNIDGKLFDIFCDDIGLFADKPIPSALDSDMNPALVGNLIFANHDSEGNTISLSDEDIEYIKSHSAFITNMDTDPISQWVAITSIDY